MVESYTDALKRLLRDAGCEFIRHGRGDHEIWRSPLTGLHFVVDGKIKSRHTANAVLRQAGLPKQF
ncbi:MAG: type II toxin-antitoxin system HicA family toxin [Rehaibacterium terrae]|uniref:type II toxin-antitoxin system HicA family toxin n=1 Tax=Rehaibacterium terrae TaxID=1341696 RepID=UPI00391CBF02